MTTKKSVPVSVTDTLLHVKDDENCEDGNDRVIFPFTRYGNVLNSPRVVKDPIDAPGAPYALLETDEVELDEDEIRELCGNII